ncbi:MAG: bifunctional 5,10-methylenetetrahydrofolate dehydrogenase/5,10-methenyltetrahydrofolate cyclohydrolase, partial [Thermoplasmata archaeon]|nr:bifunctional 5,10-methylenetetrahydrofolate dehydrogenase/5,10-methenyltetrahydrofolate cyclohydrolase [Thermoplasmata archaeon]
PPLLASVHRAETSPFSVYLKNQAKSAEKSGIGFRPVALPASAGAAEVAQTVRDLGAELGVDAVLVEHPLPPALDFFGALAGLDPVKDVDGVGPANLGLLVARRPLHVPAVAVAALRIARHYGLATAGRRIAVVGRSETVGVPLALLLLARGAWGDATVTVVHSKTPNLRAALVGAELIFSCAGAPGLLTRDVVPQGAAVIDIGLSTVPDPSRPSGVRLAGDADAASLDGWASALSPVPGGVGPVTVACLMAAVVHAWQLHREAA